MREIKFRVWDKNKKEMDYYQPFIYDLLFEGKGMADSRHHIIMQFTGLKDKNDNEIYEGDIVKIYESAVGEIMFFYGAWQIQNGDKAGGQLGSISIDHIEIIGNIYENPELLKDL